MNSELLEKERLLQMVLNNIPSYVFWKDINSRYLGCNTKFAKAGGFDNPQDLIGLNDYDMPWSKAESDFYRKVDREVMDSKTPQLNIEEPQSDKNNKVSWVRTNKLPLTDENGDVVGILGTYEDITDRKNMELELLNSNKKLKTLNTKLEYSNIDLEQFSYALSHDLQEPLRMIGSFTSLLEHKIKDFRDDETIEYLGYLKDGSQRLSILVSQILSYSKMGKVEMSKELINVSSIFSETVHEIRHLIESSNATIVNNLPEISLNVQLARIKMLFNNLITNGLKFNTSESPTIKLSAAEADQEWIISIADNGIGIDPKYESQIFKPFKRLNTRDKFGGSGIGLSICKRIVNIHNGRIWISANDMGGTTFHFSLQK